MKINTRSMLYGTMVLSIANLIVRILGFAYRIFLSRMIGPQGMGLVQLVNPVFHIAITLTVSGIPIAVSRLISEKNVKHDILGMRRTMTVALSIVTITATTLAVIGLSNLDFISQVIIKDERTKLALFVLFPCVIFIGLGATLKGFFYGQKNIHPPALSEIIEQLTRMAIAVGLIFWFAPKDNFALAAMLVMLATVFGEISSLLFLHKRYSKFKKELRSGSQSNSRSSVKTDSMRKIAGSIAAITLPITSTRLINSLMLAANAILIPQRLMASGMIREDAVGLFGIVSGMVLPLMYLPFAITNALTVVIIPNLSESMAMKRWDDIQDKINKAIHLTCIIAFPSSALLASLGQPIGDLLYKQPLVGTFIIPLSYCLVFNAIQHTCSGILNGLGKQTRAAIHFMIGSVIQLLCTYFLLANPNIGIWGILIGFFLSALVVSTANLATVLKSTKMSFRFIEWVLKPGFAALLMGFSIATIYRILAGFETPSLLNMIISVFLGFSLFLLCLWAINGMPASFKKKDHR
ncbi:MAG: polysaccharide biosynthesis protein [Clostridiales bacterium]|nr:polysaccharide biosynthesis protein [Clostridiales bacterium]